MLGSSFQSWPRRLFSSFFIDERVRARARGRERGGVLGGEDHRFVVPLMHSSVLTEMEPAAWRTGDDARTSCRARVRWFLTAGQGLRGQCVRSSPGRLRLRPLSTCASQLPSFLAFARKLPLLQAGLWLCFDLCGVQCLCEHIQDSSSRESSLMHAPRRGGLSLAAVSPRSPGQVPKKAPHLSLLWVWGTSPEGGHPPPCSPR